MPVTRLHYRSQLLLVTISVLLILSTSAHLVERQSLHNEIDRQTSEALEAPVRAFDEVQHRQQAELDRTGAMLTQLPTSKAVMTSEDPATIQDASAEFWTLSGSDLLVLADTEGRVMAVHATEPGLTREAATGLMSGSLQRGEHTGWWQDGADPLRIVSRPIVAGLGREQRTLGSLVIVRRMNAAVAEQIGRLAGSEIVLTSGDSIVALSLRDAARGELERALFSLGSTPRELEVGEKHYKAGKVAVKSGSPLQIRCYVMLPLDSAYVFLHRLNQKLLLLGVLAVLLGTALVTWLARAVTLPLERLVAAVRELARGNSDYKLEPCGIGEMAELATAFSAMRERLAESQLRQLEAERLAAIGRQAGAISHDLRHHLAALIANADFLYDPGVAGFDRDEIFHDIERASSQMIALIDSLLEIARERHTLHTSEGRLEDIVRHAAEAVCANPEYRTRHIEITSPTDTYGTFDAHKLERAFFNLLLNACEATQEKQWRVGVRIASDSGGFVCHVWDQGGGLPDSVRQRLFEPFVSEGKDNGTGLGLAIASKMIQDHGGAIELEETSPSGSTFAIRLPRKAANALPEPRGANKLIAAFTHQSANTKLTPSLQEHDRCRAPSVI